jgi:hypothetical protein
VLGQRARMARTSRRRKGLISLPLGRLAGRSKSRDEAALAVEHDDRLKAVLVIMGVEQRQLLAAVDGVERVVDVERDPFGNLGERAAIKIDHGAAHPHERTRVRQVLQPRDRRL